MTLVESVDKLYGEQRLRQVAQQLLQNCRQIVARHALEQLVHLVRLAIEVRFQLPAYRLDLNETTTASFTPTFAYLLATSII